MAYFKDNYGGVKYSIAEGEDLGLYNAQIGAIHAIASADTLQRKRQIITMPTGSGKTAVLMMTPFVLKAKRVLVLTPSRIVADQIAEDFKELVTLKKINVIDAATPNPTVVKQRSRITSEAGWTELEEADVVVTTPQCVSPEYENVATPPEELFDLILVDEAHHSPARTWNAVLNAFPNAKHILFTATPFRRDKKEIHGYFSYSYPLSKAYEDGIYGEINYVPVETDELGNSDVEIAKKAQEVYAQDKEKGYKHYLMVRTDSRKRAEELEGVYSANTTLRLKKIFGSHSLGYLKNILEELENDTLDGIIAVDMMGEGFNLPNLKIAAIHSPHKSLEVTLQFIGRFIRVTGQNIGPASFIAAVNEMEIEGQRLFNEGAVWQKMIPNLSGSRIEEEVENREIIQSFSDRPELSDIGFADLSLHSLAPRLHVKAYKISQEPVDIAKDIEIPEEFEVLYDNSSEELSARVWILGKIEKPKWSTSEQLFNQELYLVIAYIDNENHFLYLALSHTLNSLYESVAKQYSEEARGLPSNVLQRVYRGLTDINFFNVGMRNARPVNESYRILTGSKASEAIDPNDKLLFTRGHVFGTASDANRPITLGVSSSSKIWSSSGGTLPKLIRWCKALSIKLAAPGNVQTNTALDNLPTPEGVTEIPEGIIAAEWPHEVYKETSLYYLSYVVDGRTRRIPLLDLDIVISSITRNEIQLSLEAEGLSIPLRFSLRDFYVCDDKDDYMVVSEESQDNIEDFLNNHYLLFYTSEHAVFFGNEISRTSSEFPSLNLDALEAVVWNGTNIRSEVNDTPTGISIQSHVRNLLNTDENTAVIFDHRNGEIADFVAFSYEDDDSIQVKFYHCKGSTAPAPGLRIEDFNELCAQAVKNSHWVKPKQLKDRLSQRLRQGSTFVRGNNNLLQRIFEDMKTKKTQYSIVLVQPNLSKADMVAVGDARNAVKSSLSATRFLLLRSAGFTSFKVWCSD